jgi:hypothetical protein
MNLNEAGCEDGSTYGNGSGSCKTAGFGNTGIQPSGHAVSFVSQLVQSDKIMMRTKSIKIKIQTN